MSIRRDNPEAWAEIVSAVRSMVGDWSEDQIASVISKVRAPSPDELLDAFDRVFEWCAAAQRSGNDEAIATVELWQTPDLPIEILADENGVLHRLNIEPSP